ncbi:MAG: preprotein translocase subunit SecG [Candidatus Berkelbacteria bacterium Licking1014_85]|uniref:Protein-export membrane protein SecG n=1 Tax=Candidatus Berkelbacteria bacterium Licking1014_85 TaxID=2017148 RepID=A0A554LJC5_9BACT|nr:MAG: preprotein translocase subunit SecG [Candidatus Berkelbacteria bacterium Licking1014_85]
MSNILQIIQMILAVLLVVLILLQQKGTALGGAFGGSGTVYRTKRGVEKFLHYSTIVIAIIFILLSLGRFFV